MLLQIWVIAFAENGKIRRWYRVAERDFKGVWIPKEIWLDDRLNALEKIILAEIDSLDSGDQHCFKSNDALAEFCQCSPRKVSDAISKLIRLGYVVVHSFDGRTRRLRSCIAFCATQHSSVEEFANPPRKICEADTKNLRESNTYSNTISIYKEDDDNNACARVREEDTPETSPNAYGDSDDGTPTAGTAEQYAIDNLRVMTPGNLQECGEFLDKHGVSADVMKYAVDVACGNGSPVWNYVASTLYNWLDAGVKTVGDAKQQREKRKAKREAAAPQNARRTVQARPTAAEESADFWSKVKSY